MARFSTYIYNATLILAGAASTSRYLNISPQLGAQVQRYKLRRVQWSGYIKDQAGAILPFETNTLSDFTIEWAQLDVGGNVPMTSDFTDSGTFGVGTWEDGIRNLFSFTSGVHKIEYENVVCSLPLQFGFNFSNRAAGVNHTFNLTFAVDIELLD